MERRIKTNDILKKKKVSAQIWGEMEESGGKTR